MVDGKEKKSVTGTKCIAKLDGQEVPALYSSMVYSYLGIQMGGCVTQRRAEVKLHGGLVNLTRAPL